METNQAKHTRRFVDAPTGLRCKGHARVKGARVGDDQTTQCGRYAKVDGLCRQHKKIAEKAIVEASQPKTPEIGIPVTLKKGMPMLLTPEQVTEAVGLLPKHRVALRSSLVRTMEMIERGIEIKETAPVWIQTKNVILASSVDGGSEDAEGFADVS